MKENHDRWEFEEVEFSRFKSGLQLQTAHRY
jgi:hypothetical protein